MGKVHIEFLLNGVRTSADVRPERTLLSFLREDMGLKGTKCGCEIGECGACTVLLDGEAVTSCLVLAAQVQGREVWTIEGAAMKEDLKSIQESLIAEHAVQCGYCTPGMLLTAGALLEKNPHPTEEEIRTAISGNLCRCTGYIPIIRAIGRASKRPR